MTKFSQLAETLVGSEIVRLGNIINDRMRLGEEIYNYTIGDFDPSFFPIPTGLKKGIQEAYENGYTNYPPADGIPALREAVADFADHWYDMRYAPNEILIASGGRPLIYSAFKSIVDPGDKVIYAVPSWNNNHYAHMNGGEHCVIEVTADAAFMPTAADIKPHIDGAALLCLCTPQNPTGTTLTKSDLEEICDLVIEENDRRGPGVKKLYVLFDQMYGMLTYGDVRHYNPVALRPQMKDYTIYIDGISKVFAATGVRVGWSFGPAPLIAKMKALLTHIGAWAPMAEQKATADYLPKTTEVELYLSHFKQELEERLVSIYNGLIRLKAEGFAVDAIAPQAALYLTVKFDLVGKLTEDGVLATQEDVTGYLLSEARLAVVPFYCFGASRTSPWYRLSVGTCNKFTIPQMLEELGAALARLS
jgi:aspartate aminotransferase